MFWCLCGYVSNWMQISLIINRQIVLLARENEKKKK